MKLFMFLFKQMSGEIYLTFYGSSVVVKIYRALLKTGSSWPEVLRKKDVLKNFAKFTGKHYHEKLGL